MWLWGGMLYIWIISLIFYRYTFFRFSPDDLTPPYWINMGAMAISTLAGSLLIDRTRADAPFLRLAAALPRGLHASSTGRPATWWIPMLAILAVWRYVYRRFPLELRPALLGRRLPARHVRGRAPTGWPKR